MELLEACGTGVAMGNAVDKVKLIANYVTSSNEEDGIANFFETLQREVVE